MIAMSITHDKVLVELGELPLTVARNGGRGAAIVIVPSAFGVAPDLELQMQELSSDASVVVAFDPFFRDGTGVIPYDDMTKVRQRFAGLDRERTYRDLGAVIAWTRRQAGVERVVVLGICFGGALAFRAAADKLVDGVVTWHGSRMDQCLDRAADVRCPMRLHFGSVDPVVSPEVVEAVRRAFSGRKDVEIVVHEGATHGFSHRAAARVYHPGAEQAGMQALRELVVALA